MIFPRAHTFFPTVLQEGIHQNAHFSTFIAWDPCGSFTFFLSVTLLHVSFYVHPGTLVQQEQKQWPRPDGSSRRVREKQGKEDRKNECLEVLGSRGQGTGNELG